MCDSYFKQILGRHRQGLRSLFPFPSALNGGEECGWERSVLRVGRELALPPESARAQRLLVRRRALHLTGHGAPEAGGSAGRQRALSPRSIPQTTWHRRRHHGLQLGSVSPRQLVGGATDTESRVARPCHADIKGSRISPGLPVTETNREGRCSVPEVNYIGRNVTNNFCCLHNFFLSQENRRKIFFFK